MNGWRRYWFSPAPLLDLGIGRVWLAVVVLFLDRTNRFLIVGRAPAELWKPVGVVRLFGLDQPSLATMQVLGWITALLLVLTALGLLTRLALLTLFPLLLVEETLLMSVGKTSHATIPLLYAVLFFALAPCNHRVAFDELLRRARTPAGSASLGDLSIFARWPIDLFYVVLSSFYLSAGITKLLWSGPRWVDGYTLQFHLLEMATPLGLRLAELPWLCAAASAAVLGWELAFPLGMCRRWRPWFLLGGVAFHLGTGVFLDIWFWPVVALYPLFVPWSRWIPRLAPKWLLTPARQTG